MSKYIRYKNVYNDNNEEILDTKYWEKMSDNSYATDGYTIFDYEIKKEADTIEELCDEAVFFDEKGKPHYESCTTLWDLGAMLYKDTVRYCIFTDKGIIYVAKMNEKGELELI